MAQRAGDIKAEGSFQRGASRRLAPMPLATVHARRRGLCDAIRIKPRR